MLACILAFAAPVFAGADKLEFAPGEQWDQSVNGLVIVNATPNGTTDIAIQIQIRDGDPDCNYVVKSGGVELAEFTVNKKGSGGCHINLPSDAPALGAYINIWCGSDRVLRAELP